MGVWILQCLALSGLLASLVYAILVNCVLSRPAHTRLVEVVAAVAGLLGFVGVLVYMVRASKEYNEAMVTADDPDLLNMHVSSGYCHVSWSFAVNVCGGVLTFLAAIVVAVYNQSLQAQVVPGEAATTRPEAPRVRTTRANSVTRSNAVNPAASPHNPVSPVSIVPPQPGTPITNVQVFYVPHAGQVPAAATGLSGPPVYDMQYPQPTATGQPVPMASHLVPMGSQAIPCASDQAAGGGVPHAGLPFNYPTKPTSMGIRPPDYDAHYPPPAASMQPPITPPHPVPIISTQAIPCAQFGQAGIPLPSTNPASVDTTPPAYDVQYPTPATNQPPPMVSQPVSPMGTGIQAIPCASGQVEDGSTAAAASSDAHALPVESPIGPTDE